jgi:hypothetical protein
MAIWRRSWRVIIERLALSSAGAKTLLAKLLLRVYPSHLELSQIEVQVFIQKFDNSQV